MAEDHYAARDAIELIDVEYEPLAPVVDARQPSTPARPSSGTTSKAGPTTTSSTGRPATARPPTRRSPGRRRGRADHALPARPPGPMETCGAVASMDPVDGKLTLWCHHPGAARPPHPVRDGGRASRAQDPGHLPRHRRRLRQQGAIYPGLRAVGSLARSSREAGEVDGGPLGEPDETSFARDYHMHGEIAGDPRRPHPGPACQVLADHGAFNRPRSPRSTRPGSSTSSPAATTQAAHCRYGRLHQQGAGRCRLRVLVPRHKRRTWSSAWSTAWPTNWGSTRPSCG